MCFRAFWDDNCILAPPVVLPRIVPTNTNDYMYWYELPWLIKIFIWFDWLPFKLILNDIPEDCVTAANDDDEDDELATAPIPLPLLEASLSWVPKLRKIC